MNQLIRIVDDDESVRESLSMVLKMEGYEVKAWSKAKDFFREDFMSAPGCLLLDVMMPEMTGYEVQQILIERSHFIPIIFISAYGEIEGVVRSMKLGAVDFLQKPLDPEKVLAAVAKAIKNFGQRPLEIEPAEAYRRYSSLTEKEKHILELIDIGLSSSAIAERLSLSKRTIENRRVLIYRKLQVQSAEEMKRILRAVESRDETLRTEQDCLIQRVGKYF